ncbi:MAG: pyridoxal-phosphate dependent enzyme [Mesorhizobium sp.]|nr:pyridoxal-phosphate dependent enzyme [Mesorhizobium sp.]
MSDLPKMIAAEVHGSLALALATGSDRLEDHDPAFESLAVSIGAPRSTYQALKALRDSSGRAVPIFNDQLVDMQKQMAAHEGVLAELASVTPLLAIARLRREGIIAHGDRVVAVVTASGLKDLDRSMNQPSNDMVFSSSTDAMKWLEESRSDLLVGRADSGR